MGGAGMNITVYHGGTDIVSCPIVSLGRKNLDFGVGFYTTKLQSQAESWAQRGSRFWSKPAIVNVYSFDIDDCIVSYRYLNFEEYNEEWLDFIVANRQGKNLAANYDIIEGGIANDRVIDSIEAYIAGLMPKDLCLERLSEHRPNNQICFLNQEACDKYLHFVKYYNL